MEEANENQKATPGSSNKTANIGAASSSNIIIGDHVVFNEAPSLPAGPFCDQCRQPLATKEYRGDSRKLLCTVCFGAKYGRACAICSLLVLGVEGEVLESGARFHGDCFKCTTCRLQLSDKNHGVDGAGRYYCLPCFEKVALRCSVCSRVISGDPITSGEDHFHASCFFCVECKMEQPPQWFKNKKQVFCIRCFTKVTGMICQRCSEPVADSKPFRRLSTIRIPQVRFFHPECFKCVTCGATSTPRWYDGDGGPSRNPVCQACFHEQMGGPPESHQCSLM